MSGLKQLFPNTPKLLKKDGEVELSSLAGKTVLVYFSASWCPSCRGFTPQLLEFYENHHSQKNFEVVLASWDDDEGDFKDYFEKMPWLAVPFASRQDTEALTKKLDVETIPTLLTVEADSGKILTKAARMKVVNDPEGKEFPWPE